MPVADDVHPSLSPGGGLRALTPLVGREAELAELAAWFETGAVPLLTLTGPVGVGKSRLAAALFDAVVRDAGGGDRAHYLDLDRLSPREARAALHRLRTLPEGSLAVLDCGTRATHDLAQPVAELVGLAAELRVLTVAQHPLGVYGERRMRLAPLRMPAADDRGDPARLARVPAVAMLLSSLRAGRPGFRLTRENCPAVADLARRLDGLPLAAELAAARLKVTSPAALLDALDHSPGALHGTRADTTSHHLTMPGAIAHSWSPLPPERRDVLVRLAVFSGTFDAADVGGVLGLPQSEVHRALEEFVDHSLLLCEEQADGGIRFRMPSLARTHARTVLRRDGAWDAARAAHGAYLLRRSHAALARLDGPGRAAALHRLDLGHEDLLAALDALIADGAAAEAARLAVAALPYWLHRGEAAAAATRLAAADAAGPLGPGLRAALLTALARAQLACGAVAEGRARAREALELCTAHGDRPGGAHARLVLASADREQGDLLAARRQLAALSREFEDELEDAVGLYGAAVLLGDVLAGLGEPDQALRLAETAARAAERLGDPLRSAGAALLRARVVAGGPQAGNAVAPAREALDALYRLGDLPGTGAAFLVLAQAHARGAGADDDGVWARVTPLLAAAGAVEKRSGGLTLRLAPGVVESLAAEARERLGGRAYDECRRTGRELSLAEAVGRALAPVPGPVPVTATSPGSVSVSVGGRLTRREQEVAALVAEGLTNREVARRLDVSEWTAVNTLRKVMRKLDCSSRVHVAQKVLRGQQAVT